MEHLLLKRSSFQIHYLRDLAETLVIKRRKAENASSCDLLSQFS